MAAAVENSTRHVDYWGKTPVEIVDVTWTNGDTFATEWASIFGLAFTPTTNTAFGLTFSGTTVTLVSAGSLTGKLFVFGNSN